MRTWVGDSDDRPVPLRGFAINLGSNLISWTAQLNKLRYSRTLLKLTTRSCDTLAELTWFKLYNKLGIRSSQTLYYGVVNLGGIILSANLILSCEAIRSRLLFKDHAEDIARHKLAAGRVRPNRLDGSSNYIGWLPLVQTNNTGYAFVVPRGLGQYIEKSVRNVIKWFDEYVSGYKKYDMKDDDDESVD
ncbi:hypothetical protein Tco_0551335 [Tanacetum coccineum]